MTKEGKHINLLAEKLRHKHQSELGLHVDPDYFERSRKKILQSLPKPEETKRIPIKLNPWSWAIAASIALVISITLFNSGGLKSLHNLPIVVSDSIEKIKNDLEINTNNQITQSNFLINSLFVEDEEIDSYVENYILEELVADNTINVD